MCRVVKDYFKIVFRKAGVELDFEDYSTATVISNVQNEALVADFTYEEFSNAVKQMHPDKAFGSDGLNPTFFQHFWSPMGHVIFQCCKGWLNECSFPPDLNDTNVLLIPKKDNGDTMKDLQPIAFCNVLYKILAKVHANRLKEILPGVILENQSTFVPERNITDNVLVAFEVLHYMKRNNRANNGEIALKLDVSKAYDRVDWGFLKNQLDGVS